MNISCIVDVASREVSFQDTYRIASYDHNVDVIHFSVEPIEDFSLDTSSIKIAAQGPNKARHDYAVDPATVAIEEETGYITFDWPIPAGVTEMPLDVFKYGDRGQLIFAVCAEIISGSTVSKAWHSDDGIITVVAHLEPEAGGGEDPEEEATNAQKIAQLQTDVAVINTQVGALANGSPTPVATAAEMTDESAVYLYTGSETGYTAGNWYFWNGSAWTSGGQYGGAVTSTTFDKPGVPADDFAVGQALSGKADADDFEVIDGKVSDLESAFNDFAGVDTSASPVSDWEQGALSVETGAVSGAVNRIRTVEAGLPINVKQVQAINGYKFLAYAWSADSYLGIWDGNGFNKTSASGLVITTLDLVPVYAAGAAKVRVLLMRPTVSETITPSEGINLVYTIYDNDIQTIKRDIGELEDFDDEIKVLYQNGNIYQAKTDAVDNRYYYRSNGALASGYNTNYVGFIVPVLPNHNYTFTQSNLLLLKSDKTLLYSTGGNYDVAGVKTYYSGDAHYFAVSVKREDIPESGYAMSMGDSVDGSDYSLDTYANPVPPKRVLDANMVTGALEDEETHYIYGRCGIRDGYYVAFLGKFSIFGTVTLKFNGFNVTNAVSVNDTNIVVVSGIGNAITQPHGLTITNEVAVLLELKNSVMYITVESGGAKYRYHCNWYWTGSSMSEISVTASGMSFTDSKLSIRFASAERLIWYFGDSYSEFNMESRLPYYVIEYGFDKNILFNSVSGSGSAAANIAFTTLLAYGNPKYAINALGMNDGSDVDDTTPSATWLANIQTFITMCERHRIIPVLCTVPTIPTVNNNGKNAWVKASGYRYIDMAGAVGADGTGTWYTGMLGQDNIHPSPLGAVAQFMQLLTDMPEVMG